MSERPDSSPPKRRSWAWPTALVAVVALVAASGLVALRWMTDVPGDLLGGGHEVLSELHGVAEAFHTGTVTTTFVSYATEVSGGSVLQFARLDQMELFERTDSARTLWGQVELPEVVVQATAPVQYTYHLDLEDAWELRREGDHITVVAPEIRFNKPSVDASEIRYEIRAGSLLRDEETAVVRLKEMITELSLARAEENVPLVREIGRKKTAQFVRTWLTGTFDDGESYTVDVLFADELAPSIDTPGRADERELRELH